MAGNGEELIKSEGWISFHRAYMGPEEKKEKRQSLLACPVMRRTCIRINRGIDLSTLVGLSQRCFASVCGSVAPSEAD